MPGAFLPDPATYALFVAAAVALILTPGPDTLFVLSQAVQSRGLGARAALGVAVGVLFHTLLATLGIAAVYRAVPGAATAVRLLGGAYLVYLGVTTLRDAGAGAARAGEGGAADSAVQATGGFRRGFLVNAANPQVALFFLAFLPGFANAGGLAGSVRMALLGATYAAITAVYLVGVAVLADAAARLVASPRTATWIDRVAGVVLVGMGLWLALG
ncbi:LysE family translocator [Halorubrum gandharaense]